MCPRQINCYYFLKKIFFILIFIIIIYNLFTTINNLLQYSNIEYDKIIEKNSNEIYNVIKSESKESYENEYLLSNEPFFTPIPGTEDIECSLYGKKKNGIVARKYGFQRKKFKDKQDETLKMSCNAIKRRHFFPTKQHLTKEEETFPLAYSVIVFKNYYQLELQLSLSYSIYNHYCFIIDSKAKKLFNKQLIKLGSCFENVYIMKKVLPFDSNGRNYANGHLECLQYLISKKWNYVFLLQNHDFPLKTNLQLIKILKIYNGASDFQMVPGYLERIDTFNDWSFTNLNIFKNYSKNYNEYGYPFWLNFVKGFSEVTLSRIDVDYMFHELNLTTLLHELDYPKHGIDEMFWSTILSDENINFPGGMPNYCTNYGKRVEYITRKSVWRTKRVCKSGLIRHGICIHGMEDFYKLNYYPHLFINKLMTEYDAGAVKCWSEILWNKRYANESNDILEEYYKGTPHVKWRKCKLSNTCSNDESLCDNDIILDDWRL
ncbi:Glycosyl transferase, family 14-containing protein [Strongyloides ratti]|uniref:Glycosyl transferase, family 14-containing protein n=1 Tax=Strongyloides ratti TaxID=34506 RepID=A0A090MY50_STRRB|nr:Glycosyl transferase, family 14-containing protein [Strongyloides ratti]CEF66569.1 Glycosyl transferase, family 14-containing protein [Strongyloides ratti]